MTPAKFQELVNTLGNAAYERGLGHKESASEVQAARTAVLDAFLQVDAELAAARANLEQARQDLGAEQAAAAQLRAERDEAREKAAGRERQLSKAWRDLEEATARAERLLAERDAANATAQRVAAASSSPAPRSSHPTETEGSPDARHEAR